ncbi:MAG: hypothetical protein LBU24_00315 [Methanocalculaceae archaeon]|nr:hypothetical protein [Methanocalculaceae archaeon]
MREIDIHKHAEVLAEWGQQITIDEAAIKQDDANLEKYEEATKNLAGEIAVAEELGIKFDDLKVQRDALGEHRTKTDEMGALGECRMRGETAFRYVKPLMDKASETTSAYTITNIDLKTAKSDAEAAELALAQAKNAV